MNEATLLRMRLKEASSHLALVELFERLLRELRPLSDVQQVQLSELKDTYRHEMMCCNLALRIRLRRSNGLRRRRQAGLLDES